MAFDYNARREEYFAQQGALLGQDGMLWFNKYADEQRQLELAAAVQREPQPNDGQLGVIIDRRRLQ